MPRLALALVAGGCAALAVLSPGLLPGRAASEVRPSVEASRAAAWASRSADAVTRYMDERQRNIALLATLPDIVHAARAAAAEAKRRGLQGRPVATLEREQDAARALSNDRRVAALLGAWRALGFSELSFSERDGYAVMGTERSPDFVQSDEEWWQRAFADGSAETAPQYDPSSAVTLDVAARIADPVTRMPMGVIKGTVPLSDLTPIVLQNAPASATVEIVDAARRIIVSPDSARLLREAPDSLPPLDTRPASREFQTARGSVAVAVAPAHGGRWWVVTSLAVTDNRAALARRAGWDGAIFVGGVVTLIVLLASSWADPRRVGR